MQTFFQSAASGQRFHSGPVSWRKRYSNIDTLQTVFMSITVVYWAASYSDPACYHSSLDFHPWLWSSSFSCWLQHDLIRRRMNSPSLLITCCHFTHFEAFYLSFNTICILWILDMQERMKSGDFFRCDICCSSHDLQIALWLDISMNGLFLLLKWVYHVKYVI